MSEKLAKKPSKKTTVIKPVSKIATKKNITRGQAMMSKYKLTSASNSKLIAAMVAEFIGTFMFVSFFMGTQGDPRYAMYAMTGIALLIGGISGAMINPAMTVAAWATRKIKSVKAIGFLIAQALGATAAWSFVSAYARGTAPAGAEMGGPIMFTATPITAGKEWFILFAELLGAAILAFGLAAALRHRKNNKTSLTGALTYGFALYIAMFITYILLSPMGIGLAFFNPAVAFAAGGITFKLWPIAIYIITPIIGGILGFVFQDIMQSQVEVSKKSK